MLQRDLQAMDAILDRRKTLRLLAGACLLPVLGCGTSSSKATDNGAEDSTGTTSSGTGGTCSVIPEETAGPYPGDGSNGPNALNLADIVRKDITSSIGTLSGKAEGVPLTLRLKLVNSKNSCASLAGFAIYLWHCDRDGKYSLYNLTNQNYLRGVQETDAEGVATFVSVFPGCYSGRMPHIHFEIYPNLAKATSSTNKVKTSQLAFPEDICNAVYATSGYSASVSNFARTSFASDNVFSDGHDLQLASVSGSVSEGLVADLMVTIAV